MSYQIGNWGFVRWLGGPPQLVTDHMHIFTKPGQPGVSAQLMGAHGDSFDVELHAVFETHHQGLLAEDGYRFLVNAGPVLVMYNGVDYYSIFSHRYLVLRVNTVSFTRHPRLMGLNYDYHGGWLLKSRWLMLPVTQ